MAFKNRVVEHPNRIKLVDAASGNVLGVFDMTAEEGVVTEEGTALTAENLNKEVQSQAKAIAENTANTAVSGAKTQLSRIKRGTTYKTVSGKKTTTMTVKYGTTMPGNAHVVVTPITGNPANIRVSVKSKGTTTFTVAIYNGTKKKAKIYFSWIAMY